MVHEGCPGHGPIHLLSASAAEIGFQWDPHALAWVRPGLPLLSNLAGPIQHFKATLLDAWRNKVTADLCGRKGFRGGPLLDIHGSLQLLNSSHVRERDKAMLRSIIAQIFVCVVTRSTTAEVQHNDMMMRTNVQNELRHEMALEMWIVSVHEKSEQL